MNRAATMLASALLAVASFAGVWAIWSTATAPRRTPVPGLAEPDAGDERARFTVPGFDGPTAPREPRVPTVPRGHLILASLPGGEIVVLNTVPREIENAERRARNRPFEDDLRAAEAKRKAEEERLRQLNEEESQQLKEQEHK